MPEPSKPNYTDSQARADVWVKGEAVTVFTAISGFFFSLILQYHRNSSLQKFGKLSELGLSPIFNLKLLAIM